uniref:Alpha 1,4-glycosyltransferase domain-containing protein n=1 Tax=Daphnia galeata TaxID=27404 RepID=A0A8J2WIX2_9CRUS|nr:unnamed protein product [Daphnia galeata]
MGIVKRKQVYLDFSGIRALTKVNESSVMIEEYIRDVLGDPVLEFLTKEEKLQIFGSIFSRCPSKFKLSPGHKVTFQIMSEVCKEIVQRWTIICKVKPRQSVGVPSAAEEFFIHRLANKTGKPISLTDQVVGVHTWNKLTYNKPIYKNSTQYYAWLARTNCPAMNPSNKLPFAKQNKFFMFFLIVGKAFDIIQLKWHV